MVKPVYRRIPASEPIGCSSDLLPSQDGLPTPPGSPPAVPAPQALWFFGGGLLGLVVIARRRKV
jgi:hypothetical protein